MFLRGGIVELFSTQQLNVVIYINIVKYLTDEQSCNPSCLDDLKFTPLHCATLIGHIDTVRFLALEKHCDPMCTNYVQNTPLHLTVQNGHVDIVKFLTLEMRCDPSNRNANNVSALHLAVAKGHFDIVQFFISDLNCDPTVPGGQGDAAVSDAREVESQWQRIKRAEREDEGKGALDGLPRAMPALSYAQALGERASRVGFEWEDIDGALGKVQEELDELQQTETASEREAEFGDVLFTIVNVARWLRIDAEGSLRATGDKFRARFGHMERRARESGRSLRDMSMDEREDLWVEAKQVVG